jgi:rare lipoprotein A (peptidoglycan hydrolase)
VRVLKSRIIDLSHAAAAQLGITDGGLAPVTLEVVETPPVDPQNSFSVTSSRKRDRVRASPQPHRVLNAGVLSDDMAGSRCGYPVMSENSICLNLMMVAR